jgi:hypothetical protein
LGTALDKALNPKSILGGVAGGLAVAGVVSYLGDATQAAAEFSDSVSATGVIFGDEAIPPMEEWASKAAAAFGSSKQDALAAANSIAVFGKSAGLAGNDLIAFSTELTQLGGDLASMFGGTTEDAIGAVGSALRGEFEPIRRYGVLLDDATLRQQALEMGIISTTKNALTPQQRVLAAQAAIFAQTSDAQGDFARTSDGMMNTQRTLAAELENVSIEIGEQLLPIMVEVARFAVSDLIPAFRAFVDYLKTAGKNVGEFVDGVSDYITTAQIRFGDLGATIERHANDAGYDVARFKDFVIEGMTEMNLSLKEAEEYAAARLDGIPRAMTDASQRALAAWKQADLGGAVAADGPEIDAAAADMADGVPAAMEDAKAEAQAVARSTPGSLANELRAGIEDYDKAIDELADVATNSVSDLAERQKIEGILASQELTDALNSDSTRTRLLAMDLVSDLISDYGLLAPGALAAGELVDPALADGINANVGLAEDAAGDLKDAAGNPLVDLGTESYGWGAEYSKQFMLGMASYWQKIRNTALSLGEAAALPLRHRSPPKIGPLSEGSDKWGAMYGQMFAEGIGSSISDVAGASLAMAGAAVPAMGVPSLAMPAMGMAGMEGMTAGPTWIVNVNGVQRSVGSPQEAIDALVDLGAFSEGRL